MENKQNKLVFLAESVSISEQSRLNPIFLTIDVKLCDSKLNQNREGTTAAFIQDVVTRQTDHMCLPFYADVDNLLAGNYQQLGHLYNRVTRTFGTNMIGSFSEFYTMTDNDGVISLYGKIKVPKRDRDIIYRLVDLYEMGRFAVSVELSYDPRELVLKDGGKFIDVSENSALTGLCLVWSPACADAMAYDMVAERLADGSEIVAGCEEQASDRGEKILKDKEEMTAEVTETTEDNKETVLAEEENPQTEAVVIAEGEGASDSGSGASESDSGSGASDSGSGASDSGAGGSDSGEDDGDDDDDDEDPALTVDPSEEQKRINAETEQAQAEVLSHSIETRESVENWGGEPLHTVEVTERIIETIDEANTVIAEKDQKIKELETQIAELKQIEEKYNAIVAEEEAKVLAQKQEKARAFAEKQGLDVNDVAVAEAVKALDYTKIAELTMAQVQDEEEPEQKEEPVQRIALANFVELDIGDDNKYGGLLKPRNK